MKRIYVLIGMALFTLTGSAQELKLEEVLDNYFRVNGFDKMQKV